MLRTMSQIPNRQLIFNAPRPQFTKPTPRYKSVALINNQIKLSEAEMKNVIERMGKDGLKLYLFLMSNTKRKRSICELSTAEVARQLGYGSWEIYKYLRQLHRIKFNGQPLVRRERWGRANVHIFIRIAFIRSAV